MGWYPFSQILCHIITPTHIRDSDFLYCTLLYSEDNSMESDAEESDVISDEVEKVIKIKLILY